MNKTSVSRRNFLKGVGVGAGLAVMSGYFVEAKQNTLTTRTFSLSFEHNMRFDTAKVISLWSPLAMPHTFQNPYNLNVTGNFSRYTLERHQQTPMLHATWDGDSAGQKNLKISFDLATYLTKNTLSMPDFDYRVANDRYIRTDGVIADIAQSLVSLKDTDSNKARKIFEWVVSHIPFNDAESVKGIRSIRQNNGQEIMRGEDISASSVFVAMCRSVGIPATEAFGLKLDASRYGEKTHPISTPQTYTRSAVKIGKNWVPNDVILAIDLFHQNQPLNRIMEVAFDQWDSNWALLSFSRDVTLDNSRILLSTLQEAYGEIDGTKLSSYDMSHFKTTEALV